jgi:hypothetical protein
MQQGDPREIWKSSPTYLAGSVNDFRGIILVLVFNDLTEGVFDGRIVALDKMALYELDGER